MPERYDFGNGFDGDPLAYYEYLMSYVCDGTSRYQIVWSRDGVSHDDVRMCCRKHARERADFIRSWPVAPYRTRAEVSLERIGA